MTLEKLINNLSNIDYWILCFVALSTYIFIMVTISFISEIIYKNKYKAKYEYKLKLMEKENDKT